MAGILILTPKSSQKTVEDQVNSIICDCECGCEDKTDIEEILDRAFCTNCPKCIAKFMEDINKLGLFKCNWEVHRFHRNQATFSYTTSKYRLVLTIDIEDKEMRLARHNFPTHFSGICTLRITNKLDASKSKSVTLFDLHCDASDKTTKTSYIEMMKMYIETTFGINLDKWNEIAEGERNSSSSNQY